MAVFQVEYYVMGREHDPEVYLVEAENKPDALEIVAEWLDVEPYDLDLQVSGPLKLGQPHYLGAFEPV
jgi:hypothetical protein